MFKKRWVLITIGVVVLLVIMGFFLRSTDDQTAELYVKPDVGPFQVAVTTTGELQAKNSVKIYGPNNTRQLRIFQMKVLRLVPEGTVVKQGEFVAELDRSELTSQLKDAELELQKAQSQYEQTQLDTSLTLSKLRDDQVNLGYSMEESRLRKDQAVFEAPSVQRQAEIDFEKAERSLTQAVENYKTQVAQARAKMREVEADLSKSRNQFEEIRGTIPAFTINAPENGMVVYKREWNGQKLTTGGTINAWDPVVATLPDLSTMESITYVNEVDIQKIKEGQQVEIGLDADAARKLSGTVTRVANIGEQRPNSDAKVFEVGVQINEADTTLRPAMTTSNTIIVAEVPDVLHVPLETLHTADSLTYVFLRRGSGAVRQEVRLGLLNENEAVVEAGLDADARLYLSMPADTSGIPLRRLEAAAAIAEK